MKNPDEAIERVMQGIRDAKAPEGMEQRIGSALLERTAEPRVRVARPWMWSFGVASVAAAALIAVWVHRDPQQQINQIAVKRNIVTPTVTHEIASQMPVPVEHTARLKAKPVERLPGASVSNEDELAMSEMMAPSQPAPPVPLTEQEKLLLQMVHHVDPTELAMLEPEARAAQLEKEKAEVRNFFEPSTKAGEGNE